jgi:hypothetical protein
MADVRCHILPVQEGHAGRALGQPPNRPDCDDLHNQTAAGPATTDLNFHGGPVIAATQHTFYFLNCPSSCFSDWGIPFKFLTDLFIGLDIPFVHVSDQYVGVTASGRYLTSGSGVQLTGTQPHTLTDSQLRALIMIGVKFQFPNGGGGGYNRMYSFFLPQGQDLCFDNSTSCYCPDNNCNGGTFAFCAYHGSFNSTDAVGAPIHIIYQAQPYLNVPGCQVTNGPNGSLIDSTNNVLSHEIFETITDPDLNAWWRTSDGSEIGDICNFNLTNPILFNGNSYTIQKEYSNQAHQCVSSSLPLLAAYARHSDFNGDGKADVLWRNVDGTVAIWEMSGGTILSSVGGEVVPNGWQIVGTGDFDGDGKSDIVWRCSDTTSASCPVGQVAIWLMNTDGSIKQSVGGEVVPDVWQIVGTGDFDGDGKSDIVWRCADATSASCPVGQVAIWLMNANGSIKQAVGGQVVSNGWQIYGVSDFDGDGKSDILWRCTDSMSSACANGEVAIWLMNSDGSIKQSIGGETASPGWQIYGTGDFDGDGKRDILWRCLDSTSSACGYGEVAIWLMNADGSIKQSVGGQIVPTGWTIAGTGDFDADGITDILWQNTNGTVAIWLMNANGTFKQSVGGQVVGNSWALIE